MKEIIDTCELQLKKNYRLDYEELLLLVLVFLGDTDIEIKNPGPTCHARWMQKALYCLKIFIFRNEFILTTAELKRL